MMGTTGLSQLRVDCIVGIYPHERAATQTVLLDLELDYDFAPAAASDAIPDAVDYDGVASSVTTLLQERRFQLLESMAEHTSQMLFDREPRIRAVRMTIRKPAAVPAADASFVRVERVRS